ncbi:beta-ketoacyl synthase N-terminal-like domain-containing protein [Ruegeria sp. 2205SS24-7]|uniref:beta-ketoacyl synthase N-terminal-like domain-containing protein n=1 Tax=Ruegeria discodermiae TaxID=3064389 RepID=UPI00274079B0|nr:beta-ketoacyl synthase N-terminal-like domain-containing protein [Ruegeria sp. 2205SS24-7]MDP5217323.1 beta-ketoacyl synthase N-terminal-like domain-containing protein [Ruegeria sp. 2205SS24-7]
MMQKANIVGIGAVSGYGIGITSLVSGLKSGVSAVQPQPGDGTFIHNEKHFARAPIEEPEDHKLTRFSVGFEAAFDEAIADARKRGWTPGARVAIVQGSARGDVQGTMTLMEDPKEHIRRTYISCLASTPMAVAAKNHGFHGPVFTVNGTCATGLFALATAQRLLICDDATDVIVCGTDIGSSDAIFDGLEQLGVLVSDRPALDASKPMNPDSQGFVMGEGCGVLVLSKAHADSRYMTVGSSVMANDGYHPISIDPEHLQIAHAIEDALRRADISAEEIQTYVAHGTGTQQCNASDLHAFAKVPNAGRVLAPKPYLGHTRAAASVLETIILACHAEGRLDAADLEAIAPDIATARTASAQFLPALHMSLGAGGNVATAVYEP